MYAVELCPAHEYEIVRFMVITPIIRDISPGTQYTLSSL